MLSVQTINNHIAKYVKLPEAWRSKNYVYEFLEIIVIIKEEILNNWSRSSFHTIIIDESTDITVSKMLIFYIKFRNIADTSYCTIFAGIIKLNVLAKLLWKLLHNFIKSMNWTWEKW